MPALPVIDRVAFAKYAGLSLPRHVAYPMPTWWRETDAEEADRLRRLSMNGADLRDLSLYLHIPFCEKMCRFCACNRTILRKDSPTAEDRVERYLDAVIEEMRRRASDIGARCEEARRVRQIHWGGGTPTYLTPDQIRRLHEAAAAVFRIDPGAEISIEVDPRVTTRAQLALLRELGFNRVSLGVQDFDPTVQEHVGRVQPLEMVEATMEDARELGFLSVNFDLIYGLPHQTIAGVAQTVDRTCDLRPDRIAFYHYAQIPERIANQRGLDHHALPDSDAKLTMMLEAADRFGRAGYAFIGLDHFALPDEMLARAQREGRIHRSFQGMTTGVELDLFGFGCSAISVLPRRMYLQNVREPSEYVERIESGLDPAVRGLELTRDDAARQAILMDLYCHAEVSPARLWDAIGLDAAPFLKAAAPALNRLAGDGLIVWSAEGGVRLTDPLGRVLMRNVAAIFDAYLGKEAPWTGMRQAFSASA